MELDGASAPQAQGTATARTSFSKPSAAAAPSAPSAPVHDGSVSPSSDGGASAPTADPSASGAAADSDPSASPSPAPGAAADSAAPPAAAAAAPATAPARGGGGSSRRGSTAAAGTGEELPLSLQRKQRQRRPPAGWDMDNEVLLPLKRPKTDTGEIATGTAPTGSQPQANGTTTTAAGAAPAAAAPPAPPSQLASGTVPYGTLFFRAQGRTPNLLFAFDGNLGRPILFREASTPGAEPSLLTDQEKAEEGAPEKIKCLGFARQDTSGGSTTMRLATLSEVHAHFRNVLDPSSPSFGRNVEPTAYIIITCDKSKGWMSYEIDPNGNITPKVLYEADSGTLVSTSPAQFEAQIAQSSAKKWRHSFKASGGFLKMGPRQGGTMPPATVLDVLNCLKDLLGVSNAIGLPADKPLTQQQRRAAAAAAAAAAGNGGGGSRGGTPVANVASVKQQQQEQRREREKERETEREREREREREKEKEKEQAAGKDAAAGPVAAAGTAGAAGQAANGTAAVAATTAGRPSSPNPHSDQSRQAALTLIQALGFSSIARPNDGAAASGAGAAVPAPAATASDGKPANGALPAGRTTIRLPTRAAQVAAAVHATRGGTANGGRGGSTLTAAPSAAATAATTNNISDAQLQSAAALASTLVHHLALPLAPDVSALGLTGPGLSAAEAQAIQLVCTSVKGPELAIAVKGIMDSLAGRPTAPTSIATPAAAALALMTLPPGALAAAPSGVTFGSHPPAMPSPAIAPVTTVTATPPTVAAADPSTAPAADVTIGGASTTATASAAAAPAASLPAVIPAGGSNADAAVAAGPASVLLQDATPQSNAQQSKPQTTATTGVVPASQTDGKAEASAGVDVVMQDS